MNNPFDIVSESEFAKIRDRCNCKEYDPAKALDMMLEDSRASIGIMPFKYDALMTADYIYNIYLAKCSARFSNNTCDYIALKKINNKPLTKFGLINEFSGNTHFWKGHLKLPDLLQIGIYQGVSDPEEREELRKLSEILPNYLRTILSKDVYTSNLEKLQIIGSMFSDELHYVA